MADNAEVKTLREVVDRLCIAGDGDEVSVQDILDTLGKRSFAPLLLVPSVLLVSPLSGVPGAGTFGAILMALISAHLVMGWERLWLPGFVLRGHVSRERMTKAARFLRPATAFIDRLVGPRLTFLTHGFFPRIIGLICLGIALVMPPLELVPMANSIAASAIAGFALALVTHDGLLVILALLIAGVGLYFGFGYLLPF